MDDQRHNSQDNTSEGLNESNKARKTSREQTAPSVSRPKRAARACDRCRGSKLRCKPSEPPGSSERCDHCERMDILCVYTNPAPPAAAKADNIEVTGSAEASRNLDDRRLSRLENNVSQLLDLFKSQRRDSVEAEFASGAHTSVLSSNPIPSNSSFGVNSLPSEYPISDLASLATAADISIDNGGSDPWLPGPSQVLQPPVDPTYGTISNFGNIAASSMQSMPSQNSTSNQQTYAYPSGPPSGVRGSMTATNKGFSPFSLSDTAKSAKSQKSPGSLIEEKYSPRARPLPKFSSARLATFADPSSHEAPFRCLTYNPDTYRNVELPGEQSNGEPSSAANGGGKTPKLGKGDPIDRGVFSERDARSLFEFYREEIGFFLPILQEPLSFDHVRHRSSFLLSTILAIAAKYCCAATHPENYRQDNAANFFSPTEMDDRTRHGVRPVEEDEWLHIRSLAMSCYFQAMISKVHCLEDIQAVLLLSLWGLQDRGASPDPWVMTGSAYRLARRLGLHLAAAAIVASPGGTTARSISGLKTYLALYAFDRFFTVGFGRPETEGFEPATIDTTTLNRILQPLATPQDAALQLVCSTESAACLTAYVELARIATEYSHLVNITLKSDPGSCIASLRTINGSLDTFYGRWIRQRSPLSSKLGLASRPVLLLYNHIRLCLHTIPLKPLYLPETAGFLQRTRLSDAMGTEIRERCLQKAESAATAIIQSFSEDVLQGSDAVFCHAFDYAYMVLSHAAVVMLTLSDISTNEQFFAPVQSMKLQSQRLDKAATTRLCGQAITALVEGNRSANYFPQDMAGNLSLIVKETGMQLSDCVEPKIITVLEARATNANENEFAQNSLDNPFAYMDLSMFCDVDMIFRPGEPLDETLPW